MTRAVCLALLATVGCARAATTSSALTASPDDVALARVAAIHGGAGPWAVAGYRMGERALAALHLARGSFDVDVVHESPAEVQYSCIVDGVAAATGASVGRLSLRRVDAAAEATRTRVRDRRNGAEVVLRMTPAFMARYENLPREHLGAAGREVMSLPEADVFTVERAP